MIGRNVLSAAVCLLICSCMAGMRMVVASRAWSGTARSEPGGKGSARKCRKKMCCTKLFLCYVLIIHQWTRFCLQQTVYSRPRRAVATYSP